MHRRALGAHKFGSYLITLALLIAGFVGCAHNSSPPESSTPVPVAAPGGPYTGVAGASISFTGSNSTAPSGQTLSYAWNFGDSSTGTGVSPTHAYATAGSYSVTLTVTASGGGAATATAVATITAAVVSVANAGGPYTGVVGTAVSFSGSNSTAPSGQTLSYAWNFGDSSTGTGASPTHTYVTAGSYTVTLTVTASGGGTATATAAVTITAIPVASAGGPYTGIAGAPVSFSGSSSTAPSGQTLSYAWNFGDSSTGTGLSPTHTYSTAGSYTVTLTVTASGGGTSTATTTVTITAAPVSVANAGGPYTGVVGTTISFSGSNSTVPSGQTLTYAWNFGDSSTGTGLSPTHTYTSAGSYTVTLTVTASGGGTATATAVATITAAPVSVANAGGPYTGVVGTPVSFSGSNSTAPSGQMLSYTWNFGDSSTGTGVSPTHTYATAGSYTVTLTVTASGGGTATATAAVTITAVPVPVAILGGPYTGVVGITVSFSGSNSTAPSGQMLSYAWNFGDSSTGTGVSPTHTYATAGSYTVTLTVTASGGGTATATAAVTITAPAPTISSFSPASGPIGTVVTVSGSNLGVASGTVPQVMLAQQGGATLNAPVSASTPTTLSFVIPPGAATGPISLIVGTQSVTSSNPLTVTTSSSFTVSVTPGTGTVVQGQSAALAVTVNSTTGFTGLASLAVTGLPNGITAAFQPPTVTSGQVSVLTLSASTSQAVGTTTLTVSASASVDGQALTQTATTSLNVTAVSTSFQGRTVVDDSQNTPIGGVTVKFLGVTDKGTPTGCSGQTTSDGAGNFLLTNLPTACIGPQLISYDGTTATSPAGKYAGVNLSYTLVSGQVVSSPVLVHLPRIDNAETVQVRQNATTNQVFTFSTIPGLQVTVYAGTTISLADGTQPNPFPLVATQVPVDRLPEQMATTGMAMPFIVAFQPANAVASQPVAVNFPNLLNMAPSSSATFMTLDPTHGYMVPYGTGTVSSDGSVFIADNDPTHPGHGYGLVHFDWHGPAMPPTMTPGPGPSGCKVKGGPCDPGPQGPPGPPGQPPCTPGQPGGGSDCSTGGGPQGGDPVDLASGLHVLTATDIAITGGRGSVSIRRTYRGATPNDGPFGLGGQFQYSWELDTGSPNSAAAINLITPDGNQYLFSRQANNTLINTTVPWLQGAVMSTNANQQTVLRLYDGTVYTFQNFRAVSALVSVADSNGNTVQLAQSITLGPVVRVTQITDPVGRSLKLAYDGNAHVISVTDDIGRSVTYTYNSSGTLASVTNAAGSVTQMTYNSQNQLVSLIDPRNVTLFQDTLDANGRVISQLLPDGSVFNFAYVNSTPAVAMSPIAQTTVTDGLGNVTTYRFNILGYVIGVTDASGQTKTFTRDPQTNQLLQVTGSAQCAVCGPTGRGTVSYTYDAQGNRITATDALGNTITFTYDPVFNHVTSVVDPLKHTTSYTYDTSGNLLSITDAKGNVTQYSYDNTGLPLKMTDALGNVTSTAYDGFGNPVTSTNALGNATKTVFDSISRPIAVTDPVGRTTSFVYDPLNRVTSVQNGRGSTNQFAYDASSNLLSVTDPNGNKTTFTYDPLGRVSTRTSAIGKTESYQYDLGGNLSQFTDRRGQVSKYQYDPMNRLAKETYQDATVSRTYDSYGRLIAVNDSMSGEFTFGYDVNGQLTAQTSPTGSIAYTRDALHRVATRQVAGQSAVTYAYDPVGNLLNAALPAAGIGYTYDARNMPKAATRTNGVNTAYSYDALGRVLSLIHFNGPTAINTQNYTYDASGERQTAANNISQPLITQATTATVDAANELLTNGQTTYTSDVNGNRLTETTAGKTIQYQWDGRNRLSSITETGGNITTFKYDFVRNLIGIAQAGGNATAPQAFVVDSMNNVVSLTANAGLPISVLTGAGADSHIASVDANNGILFGINDPVNSTLGITDATGELTSSLKYEPYGQTTGSISPSLPFSFTGRVPISDHVMYYRNRFYDNLSGRFVSEDPLGLASGDSNPYRYVMGNPVLYSDSSGLGILSIIAAGAGAVNSAYQSYQGNYGNLSSALVSELGSLAGVIDGIGGTAAYLAGPEIIYGAGLLASSYALGGSIVTSLFGEGAPLDFACTLYGACPPPPPVPPPAPPPSPRCQEAAARGVCISGCPN